MAMENISSSSHRDFDRDDKAFKNNIRPFKKVTFNEFSGSDYCTSEAFKTLRTNLLFCGNEIKTVLITSTTENEGKSTIAAKLAKSLSEVGKKTLLIDADMRKSEMLKKSMKAGEITGLSDVLSGLCAPEDAVFNTQDPNFDVIFSGRFPPMPVELLGNGKFGDILLSLKNVYDYIIIDAPPVGMVIDAAVIASFCDGALFVISARKVSRKAAFEAKNQLAESGVKILGAVLNEIEKGSEKYGSGYYKRYKKYYR